MIKVGRAKRARVVLSCMVALVMVLLCISTGWTAGVRIVPSVERIQPGETFAVDIMAEGIPAEGLGSVQYRLQVAAEATQVAGVADLGQALSADISVAAPLLISSPTDGRSGLGSMFLDGQGSRGILVLDNESFTGGSALFTYGHTKGSTHSAGSGSVARFMVKVGELVEAEEIHLSLSEVLLLDGGPAYPLDYNLGATVTLRCSAVVPSLSGLSLSAATQTLVDAGLVLGNVYEIDNPTGSHALDVVLQQSIAATEVLECESIVDLAVNLAPADVAGLSAADLVGDDSGRAVLNWTPSVSSDTAGYRIYDGLTRLTDVVNPLSTGVEIGGLENGTSHELRVTAYDSFGNESTGSAVSVTAVDDVAPVVNLSGVEDGYYYSLAVNPVVDISETHLTSQIITLNGENYNPGPIVNDGFYTLAVTATDASGNETARTITFTVDRTAPAISAENLVDGGFYNTDITPALVVTDLNLNEELSVYVLNGQPYLPGSLITAEGHYSLSVTAQDKAGNSATLIIGFTIDKTAPISLVELGDPYVSIGDQLYVSEQSSVAISAEDLGETASGVSGIEYRIDDGQWLSYSGPIMLSGWLDGGHVISYRAFDAAGNTENARELVLTVDSTPPETISHIEGAEYVSADNVHYLTQTTTIRLSSSDTVSGVASTEYRIDSGEWAAYAPFTIAAEGNHLVEYCSVDTLGNREEIQALLLTIDNTPPQTAIQVGDTQYTASDGTLFVTSFTDFTLRAEDNSSGVGVISYRIDDGSWTTYAPFTLPEEGSHRISFRSADNLGNQESVQTIEVVVDNTPPVTTASVADPQYVATDDMLFVTGASSVNLSSTDNLSGVFRTEYRFDEGDWTGYTAAIGLSGLGDGLHQISYRSTDRLGNRGGDQQLLLTVDNTPPETRITADGPRYLDADEQLFVTGATNFVLVATDNHVGVANMEYRVDTGEWTVYAPFSITAEGEHSIEYRSSDQLGNLESVKRLMVTVDNTAPVSRVHTGEPQYQASDSSVYVTSETPFTLEALDALSGVSAVEFRIDEGEWSPYVPFALDGEGGHVIGFRSIDNLGNVEEAKTLTVIVDTTPPETAISFNQQSYLDGETIYISGKTDISLTAVDELSGVRATTYRFDDQQDWVMYDGVFSLADLDYGTRTIHFQSVDHLGNSEQDKSVTVVLVGVEVETEILNLPRVLVWTDDPDSAKGNSKSTYSLEDIRALASEALGGSDAFFKLVTDKDMFENEFRSGIYNVVMIADQDIPFTANFLRELRDAVSRGMGLLVSSWGNNVHPILQETFGLNFKGSLAMNESERELYLYQSSVATEQSLKVNGRVLKTELDGGNLAGVILGESECNGIRGLSVRYPVEIAAGDRITTTLSTVNGKKLTPVDEELTTVQSLPAGEVNEFTGNTSGDIAIESLSDSGIILSLSAPYGYLGDSYHLQLNLEKPDGSRVATDPVLISPTCSANLQPGMSIDAYDVVSVDEDRVKTTANIPAVVLSDYGQGKTAFLSYDLIDSALSSDRVVHTDLLSKAASHLLPEDSGPKAGEIVLWETRVKLHGTAMALKAEEKLDEHLTHLPLFDLTQTPLEYVFQLENGEEATYRYFVRIADEAGEVSKETEVSLGLSGGFVPFDSYGYRFNIAEDSRLLLQHALIWVDEQWDIHPEDEEALQAIRDELVLVNGLPKTTRPELEMVIGTTVGIIQQAEQLSFDSEELLNLLNEYLRIMQGEYYFSE